MGPKEDLEEDTTKGVFVCDVGFESTCFGIGHVCFFVSLLSPTRERTFLNAYRCSRLSDSVKTATFFISINGFCMTVNHWVPFSLVSSPVPPRMLLIC